MEEDKHPATLGPMLHQEPGPASSVESSLIARGICVIESK